VAETGQGGVPKGCQELGDRSFTDTAVIFSEGDITDTMEPVFDSPVGSGELEEILWVGVCSAQAGYEKRRFY